MDELSFISAWPRDKDVPRKLYVKYRDARGPKKTKIGMYVEALIVASDSEEDLALVQKYFG